jgi:hypothetical protein
MRIGNVRALGRRSLLRTWAGSSAWACTAPAAKQTIKYIAQVNAATAEIEIATRWATLAMAATAAKRITRKARLPVFINLTAIILTAFFRVGQ